MIASVLSFLIAVASGKAEMGLQDIDYAVTATCLEREVVLIATVFNRSDSHKLPLLALPWVQGGPRMIIHLSEVASHNAQKVTLAQNEYRLGVGVDVRSGWGVSRSYRVRDLVRGLDGRILELRWEVEVRVLRGGKYTAAVGALLLDPDQCSRSDR